MSDNTNSNAMEILRRLAAQGVTARRLANDSRIVQPGDVFLAYPGHHMDGRAFMHDAVARGAAALICERSEKVGTPRVLPAGRAGETAEAEKFWGVPCIEVRDLAAQVGEFAHWVYGRPSEELWLAGVTGTNGKTSVSQWLLQALTQLGQRCAVIGTLGNGFPGALRETGFTTPDALAVHAALSDFVRDGATACSMEVSSIGLAEDRVEGVRFDVAIFTNLTRDHLDYHGTMAAYGEAKARLFAMPGLKAAVLNLDDPFALLLADRVNAGVRKIGYTVESSPAGAEKVNEVLRAEQLHMTATDLRFNLQGQAFVAPVVGRFNASNLMAVIAVLVARGERLADIAQALRHLQSPAGRMQPVGGEGEPLVIVDYAHTPDALEKVLTVLRELATTRGGKLTCVFGCGGERDAGKRPDMGAVAERLADKVVLTSDNPRHESAEAIINDILRGMKQPPLEVVVEVQRGLAITSAIKEAHASDVILLAGKGHEPYQEIAGVRHAFDDVTAAKSALVIRRQESALGVRRDGDFPAISTNSNSANGAVT
ncbi:MAG: UDP-N-acetylmuramoyl-L-alanyl-D-glutamate--2,6-diaminopimelate ligase [Pseudomonadota bacterium]